MWRYVWNSALGAMEWRGPVTLTLPTAGHAVISAQLYPHSADPDRFTLFLTTADIACLWDPQAQCSNGAILYRDFDRAGTPLGPDWRQLPAAEIASGCGADHNLVWETHPASTARWLGEEPIPPQESLFFTGGAWNAAALGLFSSTCMLRLQPGEEPGDPYTIAGFFTDSSLGFQIRSAGMAPSPSAPGGWTLYVLAVRPPADPAWDRALVDFDFLQSDDFGASFTPLATFSNVDPYAFGSLAVAPGWQADGSGARGLYLGAEAALSTPQGIQLWLLPGAYGGT